jgi:APA family basic amino acid/polyamine antiporter
MSDRGDYNNTDSRLDRRIGGLTATSIVVANIIGAGIFTTSGIMAQGLPSAAWVLGCWVFGGFIAMAGALCYAELATRMPDEGAEYLYLRRLYHPVLGFLTGWTSFIVGFSAPIAASAMGFSEYVFAGVDGKILGADPSQLVLWKKSAALAVIALFTLIHYAGLRVGSIAQNLLTGLKIVIVSGLAVTGLILGGAHALPAAGAPAGGGAFDWTALGTAMMLVMFAYSGWNASAYVAGEMKNPRRNLPLSLIGGTAIVIVLYLSVNLFVFRSIPYSEVKGTIAVVEKAAVGAFGDWMGRGLSVMVGVALLSSLSAFILIGPRVYYAMARDRLFFPFAGRLHPRRHVPGWSIVVQGALAGALVVFGTFEQLLVYIGFALGIFPWLAVAGVFIARRRKIGDAEAVRVPGYPLVPVFFLASTLVLMAVAYVNRPLESTAAVVTVLAGIPIYLVWMRLVKPAATRAAVPGKPL